MSDDGNISVDIECKSFPLFKRNHYFYGKHLRVKDFQTEQEYFVNKHRLINRLIHGAGVVCGLAVSKSEEDQITISPGIALDSCGREIVVSTAEKFKLKEKLPADAKGLVGIYIKYDFCVDELADKVLESSPCEGACCPTIIKESYEIKVDTLSTPVKSPSEAGNGICKAWDDFLADNKNDAFCLPKCSESVDDWVFLAEVSYDVEKLTINQVFNNRPLVYSNDILYSLLECLKKHQVITDFPKISGINWEHGKEYSAGEWQNIWLKNGFQMTFSMPMDQSTLTPNTLSLTVEETYANKPISKYDVPLKIQFLPPDKVNFWPDMPMPNYNNRERPAKLRLIIQLRGDFVLCTKEEGSKCLDANHLKGTLPSGNSCEGGLFESWLTVKSNIVSTSAYVDIIPKPIGVGQQAMVKFWITPSPPKPTEQYSNCTIVITKPDGTKESKGPFSFGAGGSYFYYTPAIVGQFRIEFRYPGQTFSTGDIYLPCSVAVNLAVQQEPVAEIGVITTPGLMRAMVAENISESTIAENMRKANITSIEELAVINPPEIMLKLGVSNAVASELSASAKSVKDLQTVEGIDRTTIKSLIAGGITTTKALAESKTENLTSTLRVTPAEANNLIAKAKARSPQ